METRVGHFFPQRDRGNHFLHSSPTGNFPRGTRKLQMENKVVDWLLEQKYADPGEEAYVIRRDLGVRRIEISNSGSQAVMIKITTDPNTVLKNSETTYPTRYVEDIPIPLGQDYVLPSAEDFPGVTFLVYPGESRFIGVNPYDGPMQYMHPLDSVTGEPLGLPIELRHNAQIFVLREGAQGYFFQAMKSSGFSTKS